MAGTLHLALSLAGRQQEQRPPDGHPGDSRGVPWSLLRCPAGLRQGAPLPAGSPIPEMPAQPSFQELTGPIDLSLLATIEAPRESRSVQGTPAAAPGVTFLFNRSLGLIAVVSRSPAQR